MDEASGTWDLSIRKDESSGMRLIRFEGKLLEVIGIGIDVIAFESPTVAQGKKANMDGLKLCTKLQAVIERLTELHEIECIGYNLQTIKKHARARKKEELLALARHTWPEREVQDDNEADAIWLLELAKTNLIAGYETPRKRIPF